MNSTTRNVLIAVVVLAGAAYLVLNWPQPGGPYTKDITVDVQNNVIVVPDSPASVPAGRPGVIKWALSASAAAGYVFPDRGASAPGIVFAPKAASAPSGCTATPNPADPPPAFHNCDAKRQGAEFHCNAGPGVKGSCYSYTVTLTPAPASSAPALTPLDPWVKNE
jgi:hypothetical protein